MKGPEETAPYIFPFGKGKDLTLDLESLHYVTPWKTSKVLVQETIRYLKYLRVSSPWKIMDATANYGGDTIAFGLNRSFRVTAIEKNLTFYEGLQHNVSQYRFGKRVRTLQQDSLAYLDFLRKEEELSKRFDVIYFDPPFGETYREDRCFPRVNNVGVSELAVRYGYSVSLLVFKIPKNFDLSSFREVMEVTELRYHHKVLPSPHKVDLLFVW